MNRTLVERSRTMLTYSGLPLLYWKFAMSTATHISNRVPCSANDHRTPYQLWTGQLPDISYTSIFGCRAYAHIPKQKQHKFDPRASLCVFLGYATNQKGYILQEHQSGKFSQQRCIIRRRSPSISGSGSYEWF